MTPATPETPGLCGGRVVVYEGSSASYSTMTKVYEGTTSNSGMGTFFSSGAISVPLVTGKYYYIGVIVQGSFTRYYLNATTTPFVSFGQLSNGYQVSVVSTPATVYPQQVSLRFNQRISTGPAK